MATSETSRQPVVQPNAAQPNNVASQNPGVAPSQTHHSHQVQNSNLQNSSTRTIANSNSTHTIENNNTSQYEQNYLNMANTNSSAQIGTHHRNLHNAQNFVQSLPSENLP